MTRLLEKAIAQLQTLPEKDQDELAKILLDEINWEYPKPPDSTKLAALAAEAVAEYRGAKTHPIGG